jgi:2-polyprenyl-3-methyl-5-hydroxy-6-metoxy-1,4-benzoquinol methylase
MFTKRSQQNELMDDLSLNDDDLAKNLSELEQYNKWLGGKTVLLSALDKVHEKYHSHFTKQTIVIADVGCGGGDLLKAIDEWAKLNNVSVELIGIDGNPNVIRYAKHRKKSQTEIQYKTLDIFSEEFKKMQFDIVCLNSVSHHFSDTALINLFKQLSNQTNLALILNDLHRHWLSYYFIKILTLILPFSYLAKHDAPLSVLRAFQKHELITLVKEASISNYRIRWAWPFRFELILFLK